MASRAPAEPAPSELNTQSLTFLEVRAVFEPLGVIAGWEGHRHGQRDWLAAAAAAACRPLLVLPPPLQAALLAPRPARSGRTSCLCATTAQPSTTTMWAPSRWGPRHPWLVLARTSRRPPCRHVLRALQDWAAGGAASHAPVPPPLSVILHWTCAGSRLPSAQPRHAPWAEPAPSPPASALPQSNNPVPLRQLVYYFEASLPAYSAVLLVVRAVALGSCCVLDSASADSPAAVLGRPASWVLRRRTRLCLHREQGWRGWSMCYHPSICTGSCHTNRPPPNRQVITGGQRKLPSQLAVTLVC